MKEIPILFSTAMVQAILEGSKTQTRRIIKIPSIVHDENDWSIQTIVEALGGKPSGVDDFEIVSGNRWIADLKCPYGKSGDVLWVREASATTYSSGPSRKISHWYRADNPEIPSRVKFRWKPSIHMYKGAARIWLQIINVRVERVQDITGRDILAEGVDNGKSNPAMGIRWENMQKMAFEELWNNINGNWNENPWVWVIEFKVLSTTGKPQIL